MRTALRFAAVPSQLAAGIERDFSAHPAIEDRRRAVISDALQPLPSSTTLNQNKLGQSRPRFVRQPA